MKVPVLQVQTFMMIHKGTQVILCDERCLRGHKTFQDRLSEDGEAKKLYKNLWLSAESPAFAAATVQKEKSEHFWKLLERT